MLQFMLIVCILIGLAALAVGIVALAKQEYIIAVAMILVAAWQIVNYRKWKKAYKNRGIQRFVQSDPHRTSGFGELFMRIWGSGRGMVSRHSSESVQAKSGIAGRRPAAGNGAQSRGRLSAFRGFRFRVPSPPPFLYGQYASSSGRSLSRPRVLSYHRGR